MRPTPHHPWLLVLALACTLPVSGLAQNIFTGDGDTASFSDPDNWQSDAVPGDNESLTFQTAPAGLIFFDLGSNYTATGIQVEAGAITNLIFQPNLTTDTLTIGVGGLLYSASGSLTLQLPVSISASSLWSGATSISLTSTIAIEDNVLTRAGDISLGSDTQFTLNSTSDYGQLLASGTVARSGLLTFNFTDTFNAGDSWSVLQAGAYSGSFSGVEFTGAYTTSTPFNTDEETEIGGLTWYFDSALGTLSVVPEPSSAVLLGAAALGLLARRRRRG